MIQDTLARVIRALDAVFDGEVGFAVCLLEDLADDLRTAIDTPEERP